MVWNKVMSGRMALVVDQLSTLHYLCGCVCVCAAPHRFGVHLRAFSPGSEEIRHLRHRLLKVTSSLLSPLLSVTFVSYNDQN